MYAGPHFLTLRYVPNNGNFTEMVMNANFIYCFTHKRSTKTHANTSFEGALVTSCKEHLHSSVSFDLK